MRLEDQKNRTRIGPHLGRPQAAEWLVISVVKIGYVRRSEVIGASGKLVKNPGLAHVHDGI